jgi:hypothetical protein
MLAWQGGSTRIRRVAGSLALVVALALAISAAQGVGSGTPKAMAVGGCSTFGEQTASDGGCCVDTDCRAEWYPPGSGGGYEVGLPIDNSDVVPDVVEAGVATHFFHYCGKDPVAAASWCTHSRAHTYDANAASYNGTGTVHVCQELYGANSGLVYSETCSGPPLQNFTFGTISGGNCCLLMYASIYNGAAIGHHILGGAAY